MHSNEFIWKQRSNIADTLGLVFSRWTCLSIGNLKRLSTERQLILLTKEWHTRIFLHIGAYFFLGLGFHCSTNLLMLCPWAMLLSHDFLHLKTALENSFLFANLLHIVYIKCLSTRAKWFQNASRKSALEVHGFESSMHHLTMIAANLLSIGLVLQLRSDFLLNFNISSSDKHFEIVFAHPWYLGCWKKEGHLLSFCVCNWAYHYYHHNMLEID